MEPSPFFTTLHGYRTTSENRTEDEEISTHG